MIATTAEYPVPAEETEAYKTLVARVGRNVSRIPAEILALHVLETVPAHEWPVRAEAMDALLRRLESARKDELRIERRPEDGNVLGLYATRRRGSEARPYRTIVAGVDPLRGRCDCPDYLKNSLGLCKHVLVVLDHLHARPGLAKRARSEQARIEAAPATGLVWDPIRPLLGFGDWLDRVTWLGAERTKGQGARARAALAWFRPERNGVWTLKKAHRDDPVKRRELVESLLKVPYSKQKLGEVTERPKVRHWKCRVGSNVPRVRIPPSPLSTSTPPSVL